MCNKKICCGRCVLLCELKKWILNQLNYIRPAKYDCYDEIESHCFIEDHVKQEKKQDDIIIESIQMSDKKGTILESVGDIIISAGGKIPIEAGEEIKILASTQIGGMTLGASLCINGNPNFKGENMVCKTMV